MLDPIINNIHTLVRGGSFARQIEQFRFARGSFEVYSVCYVWDQEAAGHKFIAALSPRQDFLMAMPLSVIELHKNILEYIQQAENESTIYCPGGGYLKVTHGQLVAYGESQDFGPFDLELAERAFATLPLPPQTVR